MFLFVQDFVLLHVLGIGTSVRDFWSAGIPGSRIEGPALAVLRDCLRSSTYGCNLLHRPRVCEGSEVGTP